MKSKFIEFIKEHLPLVIGASIGFVIALLLITLGFFRTLLLVVITALGALIGGVPAVRRKIVSWIDYIYEKISGNN